MPCCIARLHARWKLLFRILVQRVLGTCIGGPEPIVGGCPQFAVCVKIGNQWIASPAPVVWQEPSPLRPVTCMPGSSIRSL